MFVLAVANYLFGLAVRRATRRKRLVLSRCALPSTSPCSASSSAWNFAAETTSIAVNSTTRSAWEPLFLELVLPGHLLYVRVRSLPRRHLPGQCAGSIASRSSTSSRPSSRPRSPARSSASSNSSPGAGEARPLRSRSSRKTVLRLIAIGLAKKVLLADKLAPIANAGSRRGPAGRDRQPGGLDRDAGLRSPDLLRLLQLHRHRAQLRPAVRFHPDKPTTRRTWRPRRGLLAPLLLSRFDLAHVDYLFIPLGGSRGRPGAPCAQPAHHHDSRRAVAWRGVAFRGLGPLLGSGVEHRPGAASVDSASALARHNGGRLGRHPLVVLVGWVLFRSENLAAAASILSAMLAHEPSSGVGDHRRGVLRGRRGHLPARRLDHQPPRLVAAASDPIAARSSLAPRSRSPPRTPPSPSPRPSSGSCTSSSSRLELVMPAAAAEPVGAHGPPRRSEHSQESKDNHDEDHRAQHIEQVAARRAAVGPTV